ncbi:MAG: hypothetical protein AAFR61_07755 [Bacteroidota bacterium]
MELKDMLDKASQQQDDFSFSAADIRRNLKSRVGQDVAYIIRHKKLALLLNLFWMAVFVGLYFWFQIPELILPVLVISLAFLVIIFDVVRFLRNSQAIDPQLPLQAFLKQQLALVQAQDHHNRESMPLIMCLSFVGGFWAGLIIEGWTFAKMWDTPLIFLIMAMLTLIFYLVSRRISFAGLQRRLAGKYLGKKARLESLLAQLSEDEAPSF